MSYSFTIPATSWDRLDSDLTKAGEGAPTQSTDPDAERAVADHVAAIKTAVIALAAVVGRHEDALEIVVNGHANPDHRPRDGFGDEVVTVTVRAHPAE